MARADLLVVVAGDNKALLKSLRGIRREAQKVGDSLTKAGTALSLTLTPAISAVAFASIKLASRLQQTTIGFETMTGSAEVAADLLKDLATFAASTPFNLLGVEKAGQQLLAMGVAAKDVVPFLTAAGDAAAASGQGAVGFERIVKALTQMRAKSKVSAEEMTQQLGEILPAWEILSEEIGVSIPEAMKLAEKGMLDGIKGVDALLSGFNKRFGGTMARTAKTIEGQFSNIVDNIEIALRDLGLAIAPQLQPFLDVMSEMAEAARGLADQFKALDPETKRLILGFTAFAAALGPLLLVVGSVVTAIAAITAAAPGAIAAVAAIAAGLVAGGAGFIVFFDEAKKLGKFLVDVWPVVWAGAQLAWELFKQVITIGMAAVSLAFRAFALIFPGVAEIIVGAFDLLVKAVGFALNGLKEGLLGIIGFLATFDNDVGKAARKFKSALAQFQTGDFLSKAGEEFRKLGAMVADLGEEALKVGPKIVTGVIKPSTAAAKKVKTAMEIVADAIKKAGDAAKSVLADGLMLAEFHARQLTVAVEGVAAAAFKAVPTIAAIEAGLVLATPAANALAKGLQFAADAADLLGVNLERNVEERMRAMVKAVDELEQAFRRGLVSERDLLQGRINLQRQWEKVALETQANVSADLGNRMRENAIVVQDFIEVQETAWTNLGNQVSTILTDLGKSIANSIIGAKDLADAFVNAAKAIAEAILRTIVEGALQVMLEGIKDNTAGVGALIAAFKNFIGLFTSGASNIAGAAGGAKGGGGGGGAGGAFGKFGGVLNALDALVSIITSIMNLLIQRRIEKDIARIEVSTRGMLAEALNLRSDAWDQHNAVMGAFSLVVEKLTEIADLGQSLLDEIQNRGVGGGAPVTLDARGIIQSLDAIAIQVNGVARILVDWMGRTTFFDLLGLQSNIMSLNAAQLFQLNKIVGLFEIIINSQPAAATGPLALGAGANIALSVTAPNANPRTMLERVREEMRRTGSLRNVEAQVTV